MIELKNVCKTYTSTTGVKTCALNNVNLVLPNQGLVFITGSSGSGKSTLLNVIGGLDSIDSGNIFIDGNDMTKWSNNDMLLYRNSYVGFIFQDFFLLDDFNVFDNIQASGGNDSEIDYYLRMVGIQGLGSRRINELSSGQKQRVAIVRAIIKNPKLILADEPTGNLDQKNRDDIYSLLKELSNNKLVIIVSHDLDASYKYGDYVISINDGIISDSIPPINDNNCCKAREIILNSKKLPHKIIHKMALKQIFKNKIGISFTVILMTMLLISFGMSYLINSFDINDTHANSLINNRRYKLEIQKNMNNKHSSDFIKSVAFTNREITNIKNDIKSDYIMATKPNNFFTDYKLHLQLDYNNYSYYSLKLSNSIFYIVSDFSDFNIIGTSPSNSHEVVISKVLADYLLRFKIQLFTSSNDNNFYIFKNYDDIVNSRKKIMYMNSYIIITGIIDENLGDYEELKQKSILDVQFNKDQKYLDFYNKYQDNWLDFYVSDSFYDGYFFDERVTSYIDTNLFPINVEGIDINNSNKFYIKSSLVPFSNLNDTYSKLLIYNGTSLINNYKLRDNEVLVSRGFLIDSSDGDFNQKSLDLYSEIQEYNASLLEKYEEKIKEQEQLIRDNPGIIFDDIKEVELRNIDKELKEFEYKYFTDNILGKVIDITVNDSFFRTNNKVYNKLNSLKIVGYIDDNDDLLLIGDNLLNGYEQDAYETYYFSFDEDNYDNLMALFKKYPLEDGVYTISSDYSSDFLDIFASLSLWKTISVIVACLFLLLTIIFYLLFFINKFKINKKQIGILSAMGIRNLDIVKIFLLENIIVDICSIIIFYFVTKYLIAIENNYFVNKYGFVVEPFHYQNIVLLIVSCMIVIVTIFAVVVFNKKITKEQSIDIILNRRVVI